MSQTVCPVNIGPRGRKQRLLVALAMALVLAAGLVLLARADAPKPYRKLSKAEETINSPPGVQCSHRLEDGDQFESGSTLTMTGVGLWYYPPSQTTAQRPTNVTTRIDCRPT